MRFKLFGFKSNFSILETNKEKKKAPKDDSDGSITCIRYRTYEEFDQAPIEPRQDTNISQASTSTAKANGNISHTKSKSKKKNAPAPIEKATNGKISSSKIKKTGNISNKIKNSKKASASQPQLNAQPQPPPTTNNTTVTPPPASKPKPIPPPRVPQEIPTSKKSEEVPNHTTIATASESISAAQSLPNLNYNQRSMTNDSDDNNSDNQTDDNSLIVVSGQTTSTASDDYNKKSTLIFMTEDHGDEDSDEYDEYEDDTDYYYKVKGRNYEKTNNDLRENQLGTDESNEYSNQAASIFFNDAVPEPDQRVRRFKHRDDDDNASQTSA